MYEKIKCGEGGLATGIVVEARNIDMNIVRTYVLGKKRFEVLKGISFSARKGEHLSIQGFPFSP